MGTVEGRLHRWKKEEFDRVMQEAKRLYGTHTSRKDLLKKAQLILPEDRRHTDQSLGTPSTVNVKIYTEAKKFYEKNLSRPAAPPPPKKEEKVPEPAPVHSKVALPQPPPPLAPLIEAPSLRLAFELPQLNQAVGMLQKLEQAISLLTLQIEELKNKIDQQTTVRSMPFAGDVPMLVERPKEPERSRLPVVAIYGFLSNQATELAKRLGPENVRLRYIDKNRTRIRVDCDFVLLNTKFIDHSIEKYVKSNYSSEKILLYSGGIEEGERVVRHTLKMPPAGEVTKLA